MLESGFMCTAVPSALPDRYRIDGLLGRGGFGTVVLAFDNCLGRTCAIKVARGAQHDARLVREARYASSLRGPHIVRVFNVDVLDSGTPYIVMEHLEGESLAEHLAKAVKIPWRTACAWMAQACLGLEEAHRLGLVHRDIKPANLFLVNDPISQETVIKVLDFGLARQLETCEGLLTQSSVIMGSPSYMSPEQIRNQDVGLHSDLWSVGVVLYQLLSGHLPFTHKSGSATLAAIAADPPFPLESFAPQLPVSVIQVVERCLNKQPQFRFSSAGELARELNQLANSGEQKVAACPSETDVETQELSNSLPQMIRPKLARSRRSWIGAGSITLLFGGTMGLLVTAQPTEKETLAPHAALSAPSSEALADQQLSSVPNLSSAHSAASEDVLPSDLPLLAMPERLIETESIHRSSSTHLKRPIGYTPAVVKARVTPDTPKKTSYLIEEPDF